MGEQSLLCGLIRGHSIPDLQKTLPTATKDGEPLPEGLLWLLLTGDIPSEAQVHALSGELKSRSKLPPQVQKVLAAMPEGTHPMTQFSQVVSNCRAFILRWKSLHSDIHSASC